MIKLFIAHAGAGWLKFVLLNRAYRIEDLGGHLMRTDQHRWQNRFFMAYTHASANDVELD